MLVYHAFTTKHHQMSCALGLDLWIWWISRRHGRDHALDTSTEAFSAIFYQGISINIPVWWLSDGHANLVFGDAEKPVLLDFSSRSSTIFGHQSIHIIGVIPFRPHSTSSISPSYPYLYIELGLMLMLLLWSSYWVFTINAGYDLHAHLPRRMWHCASRWRRRAGEPLDGDKG